MRHTPWTLLVLLALSAHLPGCALIDGLTGDGAAPADARPDADNAADLDMPAEGDMTQPDADMPIEADMPTDMTMMDMPGDMDADMIQMEDMDADMQDMPDPAPMPPRQTFAVSALATCAIKAGDVYCWGDNSNQLLGVGSMARWVTAPMKVTLGARAQALSAGSAHFCALLEGGALKCWGDGGQGRLGINSNAGSPSPAQVMGLTQGVLAVDAGAGHTCALLEGGALKCWGANFSGQLGDASSGQSANKLIPTQVFGMEADVTTFSAGASHTCALHDGALKCWGDNEYGQLGDGMMGGNAAVPKSVMGLGSGVTAVSAGGRHTCAIQGGALYCWGYNVYGQLGVEGAAAATPTQVPGMSEGVTAVSAGTHYTCAIKDNALSCWGDDEARQLGTGRANPAMRPAFMPIPVPDHGADAREIVAGDTHTCARAGEQLSCWGYNYRGQLAQPTLDDRIVPTPIQPTGASPDSFTALHTSRKHTCGIASGAAFCWGDGFWGTLGDGLRGSDYKRTRPAPVTELAMMASAISAGDEHTCGIKDGVVYCWGRNLSGQLGDGTSTDRLTPVEARNLRLVGAATHVAAGESHSCAIVAGAVYCWGSNASSQLGVTTTTPREPNLVTPLDSGVTALAASSTHTCAIKGGALYCWGRNLSGQLGTGGVANVTTPTVVMGLDAQVSAVATSAAHTCAIHQDVVKCWGNNSRGQLGDSSTTDRRSPGPVTSLSGTPTRIAVGDQHSCAALASGVRCWGSNADGQLGNNDQNASPMNRLTPDPVAGPLTDVVHLTAAGTHTCAVQASGEGLCWGNNDQGQLGSGQGTSLGPIPVALP